MPIIVTIYWNTEADGTPVAEDLALDDPAYPRCHYGPFGSWDAAEHWMSDVYPDDDTDVRDIVADDLDLPDSVYVNHPSVVELREA